MFGRVEIVVGQPYTALMVPSSAVITDEDEAAVFVVRTARLARRKVHIRRIDAEHTAVLEGLEAGELVVRTITPQLRDGLTVVADVVP